MHSSSIAYFHSGISFHHAHRLPTQRPLRSRNHSLTLTAAQFGANHHPYHDIARILIDCLSKPSTRLRRLLQGARTADAAFVENGHPATPCGRHRAMHILYRQLCIYCSSSSLHRSVCGNHKIWYLSRHVVTCPRCCHGIYIPFRTALLTGNPSSCSSLCTDSYAIRCLHPCYPQSLAESRTIASSFAAQLQPIPHSGNLSLQTHDAAPRHYLQYS